MRCNVPVLGTSHFDLCGLDPSSSPCWDGEIKPIFEEEKMFYASILEHSLGASMAERYLDCGVCFITRQNEFLIDGKKVFRVRYDLKSRSWSAELTKSYQKNKSELVGSSFDTLISANRQHLESREAEALAFLRAALVQHEEKPFYVSFSGGKDSTVTLGLSKHIVPNVKTVFINTGIEFDETVEYSHMLCRQLDVRLIELHPPRDFFGLMRSLGPPSRRMRWCCKTQKLGPLNRFISEKHEGPVLMASGIRAAESNSRCRLDRVQVNHLVPDQVLVMPILDWSALEVWLYILQKGLPFNPLYRLGYHRVGCWACPGKSSRDTAMVSRTHAELAAAFADALQSFAVDRGLDSVDDWVEGGLWKQWRTKWHRDPVCARSACEQGFGILYRFDDTTSVRRVTEFLRVFGKKHISPVGCTFKGPDVELRLIGSTLRVITESTKAAKLVEKQVRRALNCVGCGACIGVCSSNALSINAGEVSVGDSCTGCLRCLSSKSLRMSCVGLNYRPEILSIEQAILQTGAQYMQAALGGRHESSVHVGGPRGGQVTSTRANPHRPTIEADGPVL